MTGWRRINPRFDEEYRYRRRRKRDNILYPLLKINSRTSPTRKKLANLYERHYGRPFKNILEIDTTSDDVLVRVLVDLMRFVNTAPMEYMFYISAQQSPHRPYQLEQKYQRLTRWARNFEAPYPVDRFMAMVLDRLTYAQIERAEKGEKGPLKKSNIHGVESITYKGVAILNENKAQKIILNYIIKRLRALLEKNAGLPLREKKALLALLFIEILKAFGIELPCINEDIELRLEQALEKPTVVVPEGYVIQDNFYTNH